MIRPNRLRSPPISLITALIARAEAVRDGWVADLIANGQRPQDIPEIQRLNEILEQIEAKMAPTQRVQV